MFAIIISLQESRLIRILLLIIPIHLLVRIIFIPAEVVFIWPEQNVGVVLGRIFMSRLFELPLGLVEGIDCPISVK